MTDDRTRMAEGHDEHFVALHSGFRLGKYELQAVVGQGGFGITYRAWDSELNRAVAIKEYLPSDVAVRVDGSTVRARSRNDQESFQWGLERFLEEARALARFEATQSIVRVYDYMQANGTAYMVMALIEGTPLSSVYRREAPLSEERLKAIVLPVLEGLDDVHRAGFLHRDIKPANILIRPNGSPVLIDFGAARQALGEKSRSITSVFTPGYAPFEQYTSSARQGPWTDIYALAATLYHGISGKAPPQATDRIREDPMEPAVHAGAGRYTPQFLAAIDRGLEVFANRRPQSIVHWRDMLTGATTLAVLQTQYAELPSAQAYANAHNMQPGRPPAAVVSQPPHKSRLPLIAAAVALVLVSGGAAAFFALSPLSELMADETVQQRAQRLADEAKRAADQARLAQDAAEAEMKKRAEQEAAQKAAEEARRRADADLARQSEQAKREAERAQRESDGEARRKADEEVRKIAEAEAQRKAETERLEQERRVLEAARQKAEAELVEARRQATEARQQADALRAQAETARLAAEEDRKRLLAEADTRRKAEEEAKKKAETEAKAKADAEKVKAEAAARKKTEDEAKARADAAAAAKKKADDEAKAKAEAAKPHSPADEKARTDAALGGLLSAQQAPPPITSADVRAAPSQQQAAVAPAKPDFAYGGSWTLIVDCPNVTAPPFVIMQIYIGGPSFTTSFYRDGRLTGEISGTSLRAQFTFTGRNGDGFKATLSASARGDREFRGAGIVSGFNTGAGDRQCPVTLSR